KQKNEIEEDTHLDTSLNSEEVIIPHIDYPVIENETIKIKNLPDMNEAQERNEEGNPPSGIITTTCGEDNSKKVCFFKDDCPILNAYDKIIYERLEKNEVIAIEVRWCHKYQPKHKWTNLELYKESMEKNKYSGEK